MQWNAMKWLFRYVKGPSDLGIKLKKPKEWVGLKSYGTLDFARDIDLYFI